MVIVMSHPVLTMAVERALARFDQLEREAGPLQTRAIERLWTEIDAIRADLRSTLQSVDAIRSEQARLRRRDEECVGDHAAVTSPEGMKLVARLVTLLGTGALTDDALCKLAALKADEQAGRTN